MHIDLISIVENLLQKNIFKTKLLSNSFNINCVKITTTDKKNYIIKFYQNKKNKFNAIKTEAKNLIYFNKEKINIFPKVINSNNKILIMEYIKHNKNKPKKITKEFLKILTSIHLKSSNKYGFYFDTQVGGLRQSNSFTNNWISFFAEKRMYSIYKEICKTEPMPKNINNKIELLINNLSKRLPSNPRPALLHGDLWEGNILFNNKKLIGLIDPGSFYGHNEMEIAYLRWFNPSFIGKDFINMYKEFNTIEKNYFSYEPIYQLYYSLMNVHLWDRSYIQDVQRLLKKIRV